MGTFLLPLHFSTSLGVTPALRKNSLLLKAYRGSFAWTAGAISPQSHLKAHRTAAFHLFNGGNKVRHYHRCRQIQWEESSFLFEKSFIRNVRTSGRSLKTRMCSSLLHPLFNGLMLWNHVKSMSRVNCWVNIYFISLSSLSLTMSPASPAPFFPLFLLFLSLFVYFCAFSPLHFTWQQDTTGWG